MRCQPLALQQARLPWSSSEANLSPADLTVVRGRDIRSAQRTSLRAAHAVLVVERVVIEYATIKLALVIERAAVIGIVARAVLA